MAEGAPRERRRFCGYRLGALQQSESARRDGVRGGNGGM
jgi:hypothetical protein